MAVIRRLFGIADDSSPGGSEFDELTMGAISDATIFWPVTGGTLDWNVERIDRNDEVRGRRSNTAPKPFRSAPVMTVPVPAYRSVVEKIVRKTLGFAATTTGTGPAAITHTWDGELGFGSQSLPSIFAQLVRDDHNHKMSGGAFNRMSYSFPLDGEGTVEVEIWGLYAKQDAAAAPSVSFTGLSDDVMMLRDAVMKIDGSMTAVPDLTGFDFAFVNNLARKWYAGRNIVTQSLGTPVQVLKQWFPTENKLGAAPDITYTVTFGNTNTAQDLAMQFAQVEKFEFTISGGPLATTPPTTEQMKITIDCGVNTDGGPEALTARDDITSSYSGSAYYSTTAARDIQISILKDNSTAIT